MLTISSPSRTVTERPCAHASRTAAILALGASSAKIFASRESSPPYLTFILTSLIFHLLSLSPTYKNLSTKQSPIPFSNSISQLQLKTTTLRARGVCSRISHLQIFLGFLSHKTPDIIPFIVNFVVNVRTCFKLRSRRKIGKRKQGNFARRIRDVLNAKGQYTLKQQKHIADLAFQRFCILKKIFTT